MFFFTFLVAPMPDSEHFNSYGGAAANCWIEAASRDEANTRARAAVADAGWCIESIEEDGEVDQNTYDVDDKGRQHFEQALLDGAVFCFHTWPPDLQEGDVVH